MSRKKRIIIIGAGPIGCYAAYLFSSRGYKCIVFEDHGTIGEPVQCTGIVTDSIFNFFSKHALEEENIIINIIRNANIYSPSNKKVEINFKKENIVLERKKFDRYIFNLAKDAGAKFYFNHKFIRVNYKYRGHKGRKLKKRINSLQFRLTDGTEETFNFDLYKNDMIIGSDGPFSNIRKVVNENNKKQQTPKMMFGIQARIKHNLSNLVRFYPFIGDYAWSVPESNKIFRVGIAGYDVKRNSLKKFLHYVFKGSDYNNNIIEYHAGMIPIFDTRIKIERKIKCNNLYLLGDAAGYLKATSGGGIIPGLKAAKILLKCIDKKKSYSLNIWTKLYPELVVHKIIHNILSKFSKNDWNTFIEIFADKKMAKILANHNRDNILVLILNILFRKPSLIKYIKYLF